nr:ankyrin repeat domain-containing protein [Endozoicomonas sp.]
DVYKRQQQGHKPVVELLIEKGANVNACRSNAGMENGFTALMSAAENGHKLVVELLIEKGANVKPGWRMASLP